MKYGRPLRLTEHKRSRLLMLWPDPTVSTKDISRELDLGVRILQLHAKALGLAHRPGMWPKDAAA